MCIRDSILPLLTSSFCHIHPFALERFLTHFLSTMCHEAQRVANLFAEFLGSWDRREHTVVSFSVAAINHPKRHDPQRRWKQHADSDQYQTRLPVRRVTPAPAGERVPRLWPAW